MLAKQVRHLVGRFQMPFGIRIQRRPAASSIRCSRMQVTTSCKRAPLRHVIKHVVHRDQRNEHPIRDLPERAAICGDRRPDKAGWQQAIRSAGMTPP